MAESKPIHIQTTNLEETFRALRDGRALNYSNQPLGAPDVDYASPQYPAPTMANTGGGPGSGRFIKTAASGIIYGQPQFFSPIHTPINWQIPSKRKEVYVWNLIEGEALAEDYTYREVSRLDVKGEITEDRLTGGWLWEHPVMEPVISGNGHLACPSKFSRRTNHDKRCFRFGATGCWRTFAVSEEHAVYVLDGHGTGKTVGTAHRRSRGIQSNDVANPHPHDRRIVRKEARNISTLDCLLTPVLLSEKTEVSASQIASAYLVGLCAADGHLGDNGAAISCNIHDRHRHHLARLTRSVFGENCRTKTKFHENADKAVHFLIQGGRHVAEHFARCIAGKLSGKKFSRCVFDLSRQEMLCLLGGYFDGNGDFEPRQDKLVVHCNSKDMADQLWHMLLKCRIAASLTRHPPHGTHGRKSCSSRLSGWTYRISVPSSEVPKLAPYMFSERVPVDFRPKKRRNPEFFHEEDGVCFFAQPIDRIEEFRHCGYGYDMQIDPDRSYVLSGYKVGNCRFYYQNEPKVASAIDFYCFPPSMPVQLYDGRMVPISSIEPGDLVIRGDGSTGPVVHKFIRPGDERLWHFRVGGLTTGPLSCTAGHKLKVGTADGDIEYRQAQFIRKGDFLLTPCSKPGKIPASLDLAWLVGLYAAEGCPIPTERKGRQGKWQTLDHKGVCFHLHHDEAWLADRIREKVKLLYGRVSITEHLFPKRGLCKICVWSTAVADDLVGLCPGIAKNGTKRFSPQILHWDGNAIRHLLGGVFAGNGCFNHNNGFQSVNISRQLVHQLARFLESMAIPHSLVHSKPACRDGAKRQRIYNIRVPRRYGQVFEGLAHKFSSLEEKPALKKRIRSTPFFYRDGYIWRKVLNVRTDHYRGLLYDLEIESEHSYTVSRLAVSNSAFPIANFTNECRNRLVKRYFDDFCRRIGLLRWMRVVSHNAFLLGDCFPFLEIGCSLCGGSGYQESGEVCEHDGGEFKRFAVLNPEFIEVYSNPLVPEPTIALIPNEELRNLVLRRGPGHDRLHPNIRARIAAGQPIRLDNRCVSHIKFGDDGTNPYGSSIVRRLFPYLAYKTKLMTAQWIVAERMILPIKVVKVGSDERPASPSDLANVQSQLAATANDPNLTLVTHHAFDYDWVGACHDNQTEVLTDKGWKHFGDVKEGDKIGTFNATKGLLQFQKPLRRHEYHYGGRMICFRSRQVDICVTPNHEMFTACPTWDPSQRKMPGGRHWGKMFASQIGSHSRFLTQAGWAGSIPDPLPYANGPLGHLPLDDYLRFIGHCLSGGGMKRKAVRSARDEQALALNGADIAAEIRSTCGRCACDKRAPRWILGLPPREIGLVLKAMMNGDGNRRWPGSDGGRKYRYAAASSGLADDVQEMLLRLGAHAKISVRHNGNTRHRARYDVHWGDRCGRNYATIKSNHISQDPYDGKVWCFTVPNGLLVTRRNGKIGIHGNSGKVLPLTNEFELISQEILDGLMINKALLNGEGPTYSNAAIGVEAMIQRLEQWRQELAHWIEDHIYLPLAKMKNLVEENEDGQLEYIYPKVKWAQMHLRDQQQFRQFLLQLHEKGALSTKTLLEGFDLDYDQEMELIRFERAKQAAQGGAMGGPPGMGGGFMGAPGGGGMPPPGADMGVPGVGMPGEMPGGMPGGMPGEMPGGMPGAPPPPGGMPMQASTVSDVGLLQGKVLKEKTREKFLRQIEKLYKQHHGKGPTGAGGNDPMQGRTPLTSIEMTLLRELIEASRAGHLRHAFVPQYDIKYGNKMYSVDFAFPNLLLAVEADGALTHDSDKGREHDRQKDAELGQLGWQTLHFTDQEIEDKTRQVMDKILATVMAREKALRDG